MVGVNFSLSCMMAARCCSAEELSSLRDRVGELGLEGIVAFSAYAKSFACGHAEFGEFAEKSGLGSELVGAMGSSYSSPPKSHLLRLAFGSELRYDWRR